MCESIDADEEPIPETIRSSRGAEIISIDVQIELVSARHLTCDEKWAIHQRQYAHAPEKPVCVYENVVLSEDFSLLEIPIEW